jgi:hypothetical protein
LSFKVLALNEVSVRLALHSLVKKLLDVPSNLVFSAMNPGALSGCWKLTKVLPKSGLAPNLVAFFKAVLKKYKFRIKQIRLFELTIIMLWLKFLFHIIKRVHHIFVSLHVIVVDLL